MVPEKSELLSEKIGTGKSLGTGIGNISVPEKSLCTKTSISVAKTLEFRRLMINFSFFLVVSEPISEKMLPEKVSEPVSVNFGIGKRSRDWYWKHLLPKKVLVSVSEIFGT